MQEYARAAYLFIVWNIAHNEKNVLFSIWYIIGWNVFESRNLRLKLPDALVYILVSMKLTIDI